MPQFFGQDRATALTGQCAFHLQEVAFAVICLICAAGSAHADEPDPPIDQLQVLVDEKRTSDLFNRLGSIAMEPYTPAASASVRGALETLRQRREEQQLSSDLEVATFVVAIGTTIDLEKRAPMPDFALMDKLREELRTIALDPGSGQLTRLEAMDGLATDDRPGNSAVIVSAASMSTGNYMKAGIDLLSGMCSPDVEPLLLELANGAQGEVLQKLGTDALEERRDFMQRFIACVPKGARTPIVPGQQN
jgi:hypothetical protein